jgi:hypothetical protein
LIPQHYESFIKPTYNRFIGDKELTDESLQHFFDGCFKDIERLVPLAKIWICVKCLGGGPDRLIIDMNYGWGDKKGGCQVCGSRIYEVGTFQARSSYVGATFEYACYYLLTTKFGIKLTFSRSRNRLYDLLLRNDVVMEVKGSPRYVINPDGSKSKIDRIGMERSDTAKKAFENATKWRKNFPQGHFYILTNAIPNNLWDYHDDKVTAIYNVTKSKVRKFVEELKSL